MGHTDRLTTRLEGSQGLYLANRKLFPKRRVLLRIREEECILIESVLAIDLDQGDSFDDNDLTDGKSFDIYLPIISKPICQAFLCCVFQLSSSCQLLIGFL